VSTIQFMIIIYSWWSISKKDLWKDYQKEKDGLEMKNVMLKQWIKSSGKN